MFFLVVGAMSLVFSTLWSRRPAFFFHPVVILHHFLDHEGPLAIAKRLDPDQHEADGAAAAAGRGHRDEVVDRDNIEKLRRSVEDAAIPTQPGRKTNSNESLPSNNNANAKTKKYLIVFVGVGSQPDRAQIVARNWRRHFRPHNLRNDREGQQNRSTAQSRPAHQEVENFFHNICSKKKTPRARP